MGLTINKPVETAASTTATPTLPWEETPEGIAAKAAEQQSQQEALAAAEVAGIPDLPELIDLFSWRMGSRAVMDVMKANPASTSETANDESWAGYLNRILPKIIARRDEAHTKQVNTLAEYQQFAEGIKGYLTPALEVDPAVASLSDILAAAASIESE